ncbi:MAG TPA: hypothetical protein ENJ20_05045 [Bacteroidetes bacterium]|nr:hypothetical protein [Bacteroidota bacterium]
MEKNPNLSGLLSHGTPMDKKVKYIGAISRMEIFPTKKKYNIVAVISGPEPQRTMLEKAFIGQAKKLPYICLVIQGKPEEDKRFFINKNIEVISCLTSEELNRAILSSDLFVGRSGYSSIMDLAKLGKPALFIPTPGQTEQEYLAELYVRSGIFYAQKQNDFNLKKGIKTALERGGLDNVFFQNNKMKNAVRDFLASCHSFQNARLK